VIYEVEPERGIAAARNRLVAISTRLGVDYVAFVDDDEWVEPAWLSCLVHTAQEYRADGVQGMVVLEYDAEVPSWIAAGRIFELPRHRTGERVRGSSTANLLLKRERLDELEGPFDRDFDLTGGSDYHLFARLSRLGAVIVWCDEAVTHEHVPASRGNVPWILKREFRTGITYSQTSRKLEPGPRRALRVVRTLRELVRSMVLLPPAIIRGRAAALHMLRNGTRSVGSLLGIVGLTYQEYKETHGR
jgi:GT2 family glycosyltransferase